MSENITQPNEEAAETRAAKKKAPKRRNRFWRGYLVYMLVLVVLAAGGLGLLWSVMDVYERSRPQNEIQALLDSADSQYWRNYLLSSGVGESYLDTLDLTDVSYYKKVDAYTDETPVYVLRFGKTGMLVATLKAGEELRMGFNKWELDSIRLLGSGLSLYVPEGAVIRVQGKALGEEFLAKKNAQPLSLGELEENREDIPGLSQYQVDTIYDNTEVLVEDEAGNVLSLSYQNGKAYYYAPVTDSYVIQAPAGTKVTVNGVLLTQANARIETEVMADFQGIESWLSFDPGVVTYTVDGLVLRPVVEAESSEPLTLTEEGNGFIFTRERLEALSPEISDRVEKAFKAYINFSGNRGGNLDANYVNYLAYLVPGSEAAERANGARESLFWVSDRDTALKDWNVRGYTRYAEDCFSCEISFTVRTDETEDKNGILFIFLLYNDQWRIVRVMNTTSYFS